MSGVPKAFCCSGHSDAAPFRQSAIGLSGIATGFEEVPELGV
jgi:hypothetical protein